MVTSLGKHLLALWFGHQEVTTDLSHVSTPFEGSSAVEPLIAALENRGARLAAIIALGRLRDERAVEPLITILQEGKGPSDSVQEALARIGTPRAIESVVERIDHMWPGPELSNVFHVLQTLGESSVSLLVPMLESENRYVRRQADLALTNIGWQPDGQAEQSDAPERHATSGEDTPQGQVEQTEWQERPQTDDCDHGHV